MVPPECRKLRHLTVIGVTVREIRLLGDPVLRTPSDPVTDFDDALRALVTDLCETVALPGRAGLAAPQIGVNLRVFSYNTDGVIGYVVNPVIVSVEGTQDDEEGCLSIPQLYFPTPRAMTATVTGQDQDGEPITVTGSGLLSRALQHETDHLDGTLYIDTLKGDARRQALRAVRAAPWAQR
jgi:peptide deformylase